MRVIRTIWRLIIGGAATTGGAFLLSTGEDTSFALVALGIALIAVGVSVLAEAL